MKKQKTLKLFLSLLTAVSLFAITPVKAEETQEPEPEINLVDELISEYAFVEDYTTGQILLDHNSTERMYPASMTKMMTVLIAIEEFPDYSQRVSITYQMLEGLAEANASVMGLYAGDLPTVEDLLYGAALPSGADACHALAIELCGGIAAFVDKMNAKAAEIGMKDTHFVTPSGLHDDDHYTTCRDMAKLLEYALKNETFRTVFSTKTYTTSSLPSNAYGITLYSTADTAIRNGGFDLPGFQGSKTGFTNLAGHCMASWADLNGMDLILVTAHADTGYYDPAHVEDAAEILQYYSKWERKDLMKAGQLASTITVHTAKEDLAIDICTFEDLTLDIPSEKILKLETTFPEEIDAGLEEQTLYGSILLRTDDAILYTKELAVKIPKETSFFARLKMYLKKYL